MVTLQSTAKTTGKWRILAIAATAQFLAVLDIFAVNVAFPALQRTFDGSSLGAVTWVLNAYTIVVAACLIPAGRLADDTGVSDASYWEWPPLA